MRRWESTFAATDRLGTASPASDPRAALCESVARLQAVQKFETS